MNYIKEQKDSNSIYNTIKKYGTNALIGTAAFTIFNAIDYFITPNIARAQDSPSAKVKENLVDKIKKYKIVINQYESLGEKERAKETRKKLEKEIFQAKTLEEYLRILDLTSGDLSKETLLKYAKKVDDYEEDLKDPKKTIKSSKKLYLAVMAAKDRPNTSKREQLDLMLEGFFYAKYVEHLTNGKDTENLNYVLDTLFTEYNPLTEEDKKAIEELSGPGVLKDLLAEEKERNEKKAKIEEPKIKEEEPAVEEKKEENKTDDPPEKGKRKAPAKRPGKKKTTPKKTVKDPDPADSDPLPTIDSDPDPDPAPTRTNRIITPTKTKSKTILDIGIEHNTNKSTSGNKHHASLISEFIRGNAIRTDNIWKTDYGSMFNEMRTSANLSANPLAVTKIAEVLGIDVSDDLVHAIELGGCFDLKEIRERYFTATSEAPPSAEYDSIKESNNRELTKNSYGSLTAKLKIGLQKLGAPGSVIANATVFYRDKTDNTMHNSVTYNTHLTNPLLSYPNPEPDSGDLETRTITKGIQAEVRYSDDQIRPINKKSSFRLKYDFGIFADIMQLEQRLNNGTTETIQDAFVGITAKGMVSKHWAYNFILAQEVMAAPGDDDDGWKDTRIHFSTILNPGDYALSVKDEDGNDKNIGKFASAIFLSGWLGPGNQPGCAGGTILGNANINTENLSNMLDDMGRTNIGLNREQGDTLQEFEKDRLFRTLPLMLGKGLYAWAYGGVVRTTNIDGDYVLGAFGFAGMNMGMVALEGFYSDNHIKRRIGGRLRINLEMLNLLAGFYNEEDLFKKHESKTGFIGAQVKL